MGRDFSVWHAACLAAQLPASARVNMPPQMAGFTVEAALLNLIERNTHIAWWQNTAAGQSPGAVSPAPVLDFSGTAQRGRGVAMEVEKMRSFLSRRRKEVDANGQ